MIEGSPFFVSEIWLQDISDLHAKGYGACAPIAAGGMKRGHRRVVYPPQENCIARRLLGQKGRIFFDRIYRINRIG